MIQSQIVKDLFKSKQPHIILTSIKHLDYSQASKKISQSLGFPATKQYLFNKASKPKNYKELRETLILSKGSNLEGELAWFVNSLSIFANDINHFIKLESEFQKSILLDDFDVSNKKLQTINEEICFSYWSLENSFSLEQKENGNEGNWNFLKKINSEIKLPFNLLLVSLFSKKAEIETTLSQYKRDLDVVLNRLNAGDGNYFLFKMGYVYSEEFSDLSYLIYAENSVSIIDKYLFLIDILFELSLNEVNKPLIQMVINDIESFGISDFRLNRLKEYNNLTGINDLNCEILDLFDLYSIGEYENSIQSCIELLRIYPQCIEIYEIYLKCLIELELGFKPTGVSESIDDILKNLFSIFNKELDFYACKENLLKQCICFSKLSFYKQLISLVLNLSGREINKKAINESFFIHSTFSNPNLILINKGIKFNKTDYNNHISIRINYSIANNQLDLLKDELIPEIKLKIYEARANYYLNSSENLTTLIMLNEDKKLTNYFKEEIIVCLSKAYTLLNMRSSLISLIVDSFFQNQFLTERIDKEFLLDFIIDNNYELDVTNIDLPIFFHIQQVNSYFQYASLEQFLNVINVDKPSEIIEFNDKDKYIYLLNKICTIDVLNNFYLVYENDDEVLNERIKILSILSKFDESNLQSYIEEITQLTQKRKINETIKTVNDGKISLNFSRIKDDKDYSLKNSFNRFIKFRSFTDKTDLNIFENTDLIKLYYSEIKNDPGKLQDAAFISFKSLFFELVDYFLFSPEHGLDGDLSTRIRHGVLENQLRSVFINNNLISKLKSDNTYKDIEFWSNLGLEKSYPDNCILKIQNILKEFSRSVDSLISKIVTEDMQVKSNNHSFKQNALFNYTFSNENLWIVYNKFNEIKDYDEFLDIMFSTLKLYTENLLENIKDYLQNDLNSIFQNMLSKLQDDFKALPQGNEVISEINLTINKAKTYIELELHEISKWFKIANNTKDIFLDIDTIIGTAVESINVINSETINPKLDINCDILFEGWYYYYDIFKIILENAIKHSKLETSALNIEIIVNQSIIYKDVEGASKPLISLQIEAKNNLGDIDYAKTNKKLSSIVKNWKSDLSSVNKEGGSGFQKIKRRLVYDIDVFDNNISYRLEDSVISIKLDMLLYTNIEYEKN